MAAATPPPRSYTAPCPGCGAPVEFRSAQSAFAVCGYCHSTVVRDGDTLARIGKVAELFEDYSPLQLGASGRWTGRDFSIVGRLQYKGGSGAWTEWSALLPDGSMALLAEDNGRYVMATPVAADRALPPPSALRLGATTVLLGKSWTVSSCESVVLASAEGELPKLPPLDRPFDMVELRSAAGEVLAIDYGSSPPQLTAGRAVALEELALRGLREASASQVAGRQFACPHCGAPVAVALAASKSVTCGSCHAIIDISQGVGGELAHALQDEPVQPAIPLGATGTLQGQRWQVVGYQHRMGHEPGDDDESFGWDEYLLFHPQRGFCFLVEDSEGWSVVRTTTGAPELSPGGHSARYLGADYALKESYEAETTYVAGEFYWPVERGQKTFNRDFASGTSLLSLEETPRERTWSSGSRIGSDTVAQAFGLQGLARADTGPTTPAGRIGCGTIILILVVLLILLAVVRACSDDDDGRSGYGSGGYRTGGGSFGGYSSGGGHK